MAQNIFFSLILESFDFLISPRAKTTMGVFTLFFFAKQFELCTLWETESLTIVVT